MKFNFTILLIIIIFFNSCQSPPPQIPIEGTWKLISGTIVEKGDTVVNNYLQEVSFIKIINKSHFAFMLHDLNHGSDSNAVYSSGGGTYSLTGTTYIENLEYCSDRSWEDHQFTFTLSLKMIPLHKQA